MRGDDDVRVVDEAEREVARASLPALAAVFTQEGRLLIAATRRVSHRPVGVGGRK